MHTHPRRTGSLRTLTATGVVAAAALAITALAPASPLSAAGDDDPILLAQVGDYSGDWSFYDVPFDAYRALGRP